MEQVAVTGLGARVLRASGERGGWSSSSSGAGLFSQLSPLGVELPALIQRESQGFFDSPIPQPERVSVVWSHSKNHFALFNSWTQDGNAQFFSDFQGLDLARRFGLGGQILCPVAACASGSHALILGARLIESGEADVVLCGATEPPQHPLILAAYANMGALSPSAIMRPFDRRRDGFLPSSGEGFLIMESLSHAQNRGAKVHAMLSGYSMKSDAFHMTSMCPSGDSVVRAINEAMSRSGNANIGYINAHGTATKQNDELEARVLHQVFGCNVPVSSTKSLTGHLLGASGAVEAVLCVLTMKNSCLPPTLELEKPDGNLDFVREERCVKVDSILSLNYGFGGHIGSLVFGKF